MGSYHLVNIGSGNSVLSGGTKPLHNMMLTNYQWNLVAFAWRQFHRKRSRYHWYECNNYSFKIERHTLGPMRGCQNIYSQTCWILVHNEANAWICHVNHSLHIEARWRLNESENWFTIGSGTNTSSNLHIIYALLSYNSVTISIYAIPLLFRKPIGHCCRTTIGLPWQHKRLPFVRRSCLREDGFTQCSLADVFNNSYRSLSQCHNIQCMLEIVEWVVSDAHCCCRSSISVA